MKRTHNLSRNRSLLNRTKRFRHHLKHLRLRQRIRKADFFFHEEE